MRKRKGILIFMLVTALVFNYVALAFAANNEGSLQSGYAVTSNYHGVDVPSGTPVIVTAMTTDGDVDKVKFVWKNPADEPVFTETKPVYTNGTTFNGKLIRYANSTFTPDAIGDWGVQARFLDVHNFCRWTWTEIVARRATSFNVIPEVPVIGTAGASIAMLAGLTYKMKRKLRK